MPNSWSNAKNCLIELGRDALALTHDSFDFDEHLVRKSIVSPLAGFRVESQASWMLNGTWVLVIEIERSYLFGLFYRSLHQTNEFGADGGKEAYPVRSRTEFFRTRTTRRKWLHNGTE